MDKNFDIAVVGAGPVGLTASLALRRRGYHVALIAPADGPVDRRTSALLGDSIDLLRELGAWPGDSEQTAPLRVMRIIDGTRRLIRSPEVTFRATEIGRTEFGFNIANTVLVNALNEAVAKSGVTRVEGMVETVATRADSVLLSVVDDDPVLAKLAIGADGRRSRLRDSAGISTRSWRYDQSALVCNLSHEYDHDDTSTEFHTENGPFTLVPLAAKRSGLVWIDTPSQTKRRTALASGELAHEIEERSAYILGAIQVDGQIQSFPMSGMSVEKFADRRIMLAGEAAHLFPPIGAQGLNLGYRDVAALMNVLSDPGSDPGRQSLIKAYNKARRSDVGMRTLAVDALNRTLLANFIPVQGLRGSGLFALDRFPSFRRWAMLSGIGRGRGSATVSETDRAAGSH
jgi:2-octaprenyl-6-methoxyphenol hydroxylase